MFIDFFKKIGLEKQGILALTLGFILILGTLGKLQMLQGILNLFMILTGLILVIWGINATKGINKIKDYLQAKTKLKK